jgi:hypothetical protein
VSDRDVSERKRRKRATYKRQYGYGLYGGRELSVSLTNLEETSEANSPRKFSLLQTLHGFSLQKRDR